MEEENISQEFILKNVDETRNYFLEKIKKNEIMSKKHKKVCTTLNYAENFLILASTIIGCISVSAFSSFIGIPIGITKSAIILRICVIITGSKKCKPTAQKIFFFKKIINKIINKIIKN